MDTALAYLGLGLLLRMVVHHITQAYAGDGLKAEKLKSRFHEVWARGLDTWLISWGAFAYLRVDQMHSWFAFWAVLSLLACVICRGWRGVLYEECPARLGFKGKRAVQWWLYTCFEYICGGSIFAYQFTYLNPI